MQAIMIKQYGGPEVLECVDAPKPVAAEGRVLIRTHTIGVGKPDVLVRNGVYQWAPPLPLILGNEAVGHVEAVGLGVTEFKVGQPVLVIKATGGCYAQYVAAATKSVTPLPEGMDPERAVGALNYLCAWVLLHEMGQVKGGQTLYLNGASGGVGTALIQLATLAGMNVIAGASSDEKCAFARARGAAHVINYSREDVVQRVLEITGQQGAHLILDQFVGQQFARNFDMLAVLGTVLVYNWTGGLPDKNIMADMGKHISKSPALRVFSLHSYDGDLAKYQQMLSTVLKLMAEGTVSTYVCERLNLSQAVQAHAMLEAGNVLGKILLKPVHQ